MGTDKFGSGERPKSDGVDGPVWGSVEWHSADALEPCVMQEINEVSQPGSSSQLPNWQSQKLRIEEKNSDSDRDLRQFIVKALIAFTLVSMTFYLIAGVLMVKNIEDLIKVFSNSPVQFLLGYVSAVVIYYFKK